MREDSTVILTCLNYELKGKRQSVMWWKSQLTAINIQPEICKDPKWNLGL